MGYLSFLSPFHFFLLQLLLLLLFLSFSSSFFRLLFLLLVFFYLLLLLLMLQLLLVALQPRLPSQVQVLQLSDVYKDVTESCHQRPCISAAINPAWRPDSAKDPAEKIAFSSVISGGDMLVMLSFASSSFANSQINSVCCLEPLRGRSALTLNLMEHGIIFRIQKVSNKVTPRESNLV